MCYCDIEKMQTKSTMYKQCKQNSRDFAKKVLVIKLDPQRFREIDAPGGPVSNRRALVSS